MLLKSEEAVDMNIKNDKIKFELIIGSNIQFINKNYNTVRSFNNAIAVEWMIRAEEALKDFLVRLGLRYGDLGKIFRKRIKKEKKSINKNAKKLKKLRRQLIPFKEKPLKHRNIEIYIKNVKGMYRPNFPTVNIFMPFSECKKARQKYYIILSPKEAIEIGYKILFWLSVTEVSESKGFKTAEDILGKIK